MSGDLEDRLETHLRQKRQAQQAKKNEELAARAAQVRTLQGMLGQVATVRCPHCGEVIVDPRPTAPDDDYETRL